MLALMRAIPTLYLLASMLMLTAMGGVDWSAGPRAGSDPHGHNHGHAHAHDGSHGHAHHEHHGRDSDGSKDARSESVGGVAGLPSLPHRHCCHEDHTPPTPVFAFVVSGSFFDEHISTLSEALPDLWQPVALDLPAIRPTLRPPRGGPGDSVSCLRTVVMLT